MRTKHDPVDQPEKTAHYDCAVCTAEMLLLHNTIGYSTETVLLILSTVNIITVQMTPSGG